MVDARIENFKIVKKLISKFAPPLKVATNLSSRYETYFEKSFETVSGRTGNKLKKDKLWFASIIVQRNYLGFYFMPVYSHPELLLKVSPELRKTLKGKSCFHITKLNEEGAKEITKLLKEGFKLYDNFTEGKVFSS